MELNPHDTKDTSDKLPDDNPSYQSDIEETELYDGTLNPIPQSTKKGLSLAELGDPNQIQITIQDKKNPIVVLFGPPQCGKTMTLVRLSRYLKQIGYKIVPIRSFRPAADDHYTSICENFDNDVNSRQAAESTKNISFLLIKIMDDAGRTICQILEAPGEYYYNPEDPTAGFPSYVNVIISSSNRKIWCYMVEPDWKDQRHRDGYVDKIRLLKRNMRPSDKAVFIFNKIDKTNLIIDSGRINEKEARKEVKDLYPGIFEPFRSKGVFGCSDNFKFIPFQTGFYSKNPHGGLFFDPGDDIYPQKLWNVIHKLVRG